MKLKEMLKKANSALKNNQKHSKQLNIVLDKLRKEQAKLENAVFDKTTFRLQSVLDCGEGFNLSITAVVRSETYYGREIETVVEYLLYSTIEKKYYDKLSQFLELPERVFQNLVGVKQLVSEWLSDGEEWPFEDLSDDEFCSKLFGVKA